LSTLDGTSKAIRLSVSWLTLVRTNGAEFASLPIPGYPPGLRQADAYSGILKQDPDVFSSSNQRSMATAGYFAQEPDILQSS